MQVLARFLILIKGKITILGYKILNLAVFISLFFILVVVLPSSKSAPAIIKIPATFLVFTHFA